MDAPVTLDVNGIPRRIEAAPSTSLLEVLRNDLDLTGAKYGCGESQCGACTVLLDGIPARSCVTALSAAVGKKVTTIEGLEKDGKLHPIQEAFLVEDAMQCGYCVTGMILSAHGLLARNPNPSDAQIFQALNGNICRCGCYPRMVAAVKRAATQMRGSP
jgi:aerobic-type carbon monoxide dehydrogenase small subunit (CoxS/CutS family)